MKTQADRGSPITRCPSLQLAIDDMDQAKDMAEYREARTVIDLHLELCPMCARDHLFPRGD